jgi:hypothetical protein
MDPAASAAVCDPKNCPKRRHRPRERRYAPRWLIGRTDKDHFNVRNLACEHAAHENAEENEQGNRRKGSAVSSDKAHSA